MKTITLRLDDEDHKLFAVLATAEDLPVATLIRRTMKQLARDKGLLQDCTKPALQTTAQASSKQPVDEKILARDEFLRKNPMPNDGLDYILVYIDGAWAWEWQPPSDAEAFDPSA